MEKTAQADRKNDSMTPSTATDEAESGARGWRSAMVRTCEGVVETTKPPIRSTIVDGGYKAQCFPTP